MLKLTGKLTIQRAAELASSIGQAIAEEEHAAVLDLAGVTAADVTFLQLLCSAHLTACSTGKTLTILSPPDVLLRAVKTAGFEGKQPCARCTDGGCLWPARAEF